jgi:hypothetical protein
MFQPSSENCFRVKNCYNILIFSIVIVYSLKTFTSDLHSWLLPLSSSCGIHVFCNVWYIRYCISLWISYIYITNFKFLVLQSIVRSKKLIASCSSFSVVNFIDGRGLLKSLSVCCMFIFWGGMYYEYVINISDICNYCCFIRTGCICLDFMCCIHISTASRGPGSIPGTTDFLRSNGSGMGSTQPREYNWGATWKKQ